jgi:NYN domain
VTVGPLAPAEEGRYKANGDVMIAIDALELSVGMRPDVVILVTGDADFAYLALKLRRRAIRVEVASVAQNLGNMLKSTANDVIDLAPLFSTFENKEQPRFCAPVGPTDAATRLTRADAPQTTVELSPAQLSSYEQPAALASKVEIVGA